MMNVFTAAAVLLPVVVVATQRSRARRALHQRYRELAQRKRDEVKAAVERAKSAGLAWEGLTRWVTEHRTAVALAKSATPFLEPHEVLNLTARELVDGMASGRLSSEYVMRCFVARAMAVDESLHCIAEVAYEEAVAEAKACDVERQRGTLRGPLHGLPLSVKEQINMKGFQTTCGACCRLAQPAAVETAVLVRLAQQAGAIPFARTNVPQLLMLPESFNAIYGTTCNPYDLARTSGGSTGGESALIAARGSPLGLGTDVGGSVRIPAFMAGLCAFKPTVDRLSYRGIAVPRRGGRSGQREVRSAPGPLARCVADLELLMDVLCQPPMHAADVSLPRMPWDRAAFLASASRGSGAGGAKRLRFGYFASDGWFEPAAPCARAVHEAAAALRAAGHEVVPFAPEEMAEAALCYIALLSADGNFRGFLEGIEGEALHPCYAFLCRLATLPNWLRPPLAAMLRGVAGEARKARLVRAANGKSTHAYWQVITQAQALRERFLARFQAAKLDALLCPVPLPHGPEPAVPRPAARRRAMRPPLPRARAPTAPLPSRLPAVRAPCAAGPRASRLPARPVGAP